MADDSFREVTSRSWFNRIGGAVKGVVFGLVLLLGAFALLFWNEGRAVERYKTLEEGGGAVISVAADKVELANEGKLVHLSGRTVSDEMLSDGIFAVRARAIKLIRTVEMYQWAEKSRSETRKKLGGGEETVTTYTYEKRWSERHIDSSSFKHPEGHVNPPMPYASGSAVAATVRLGAFRLPPFLVERLDATRPLPLSGDAVSAVRLPPQAKIVGDAITIGSATGAANLGDVRVRFSVVEDSEVSLAAQQRDDTLQPFQTRAGGTIALLQPGLVPAAAMFAQAQQSNTILTWLLRGGGLLLMFIGFRLILAPLPVLGDVVPAFGAMVGAGVSLIAGLIAAVLSLLTIAIAWVVYRPVLGLSLLAAAIAVTVYVVARLRKARPDSPAPPSPPSTPPPLPGR